MRLSNLRILLTGIGTMLAVIAQFYPPKTYPGNFWALAVCCPSFFVINMLVTYWLPGQEQDIVCETKSLVVRSKLDTDSKSYSLRAGKEPTGTNWKTVPLGRLFSKDGTLRPHVLEAQVDSILPK